MIEEIAKILVSKIVLHNNQYEDKMIYIYGLQIILNTLIGLASVLTMGAILGEFFNTIIFLACYCSARLFGGGLHANTNSRCMTIFICGYLFAYLIIENIFFEFNGYILCLLIVINLCVAFWAPVVVEENSISFYKRKKMKIKAMIVSVVITSLTIILLLLKYEIAKWACAGLCWFAIILTAGKLKQYIVERRI